MLKLPDGVQRSQLAWLCVVSVLYYAAVTVADDVAQSIFVSRLGVRALPNIFLFKAGIDVISAALYLPLTRHRNPKAVWRVLLIGYAVILAVGWLVLRSGNWPTGSAYLLYVGHEAIWSLAVIHWGILLLALISPAQTKALFPVLFAVGRLGALFGGLLVGTLALVIGAANLLWIAVALALFSALASRQLPVHADVDSPTVASGIESRAPASTWAHAWASPLVRWIALTTATMVVLRYGLRMVSLAEIRSAFDNDSDQVAAFLGLFSVVGNGAALVLGFWVVPRILGRVGVGAANLAYAGSNVLAFLMTWLWPSLASASAARFVEIPLKHALKTPLSVMFYAAENMHMRLAARALIFGGAIPLATALAGVGFRGLEAQLATISMGGVALAIVFAALSERQNHSYRERLLHTLEAMLGEDKGDTHLPAFAHDLPDWTAPTRNIIARALASSSSHAHSLAMLYIGESLSYSRANALARQIAAFRQEKQ